MPITDPLVLPVDVRIAPAADLAPRVRERLGAAPGDFTVSRPRGRAHAKVVGADSAALLRGFRTPGRIVDVVTVHARERGLDVEITLRQAFPLLLDCFNRRYLVPAGSPDAAAILPTRERGDRVGRFEVLRCLQVLDDTELYQARDDHGTLAAVKLIRPSAPLSATRMLAREAAVLACLRGAGAPAPLARGRFAGRGWLAMSWCTGVSPEVAFGELRERDAPDDRRGLLRLTRAIARAYAALHARGVLHGDVHPRNLLIGRRGDVTLLDFGLAHPLAPLRLGGSRGQGGVAWFLSPEHAAALRGGRTPPPPTPASEQYGVAAMLYALLTGHPYAEFSLDRGILLDQILTADPLPFSRRGVAPWPALERVLARALRKAAPERYLSMHALVGAMRRVRAPAGPPPMTRTGGPASRFVDDFLVRIGSSAPELRTGPAEAPTGSVMFGGAGVGLALYRLACLRDDAHLLALADVWLCRTAARRNAPDAFADPGTDLGPDIVGPVSPFHAVTGLDLVGALVAQARGDLPGADAAVQRFCDGGRAPWPNPDLTLGRAGILLASAHLLEAMPPGQSSRDALSDLGHRTLEWLWTTLEPLGPIGRSTDLENLGVAHGWAGMVYASLRWCALTGAALPASLPRRLDELAGAAEALGRGVHWRQAHRAGRPSVWAESDVPGWCNGPAGFIWLWTLAHTCLGRGEYLRLAEGSAWSAWDAQGHLSDLCCGLAGRAYGLLNFYRHTGDPIWRERAGVLASRAVRLVTGGTVAFRRPLSLFQGVTGMVLLVADLDRPEHASMPLFESEGWPAAAPPHA